MSSVILVLNCGSSSVKFALFDPAHDRRLLSGLAERVSTPQVAVTVSFPDGKRKLDDLAETDHAGVLRRILDELQGWLDEQGHTISAVGHRVVHGGEKFASSVLLDEAAMAALHDCIPLAPLHNPANIAGIEAAIHSLPGVPQVGVFDTAFHQSMPPVAYRYAVPAPWYEELGVRRYGFHGTSHQYVAQKAADLLGRPLDELHLITAHLGNGCSLTAIRGGVSVDTSMGLTPLEGVMMGTRSGDIDPGLPGYIQDRTGADLAEITTELNRSSGLLGLSRVSNDMRELWAAADEGNPDAILALQVFEYRLAKYIAGLTVAAGGLDALVFTGGIGENDAPLRRGVLHRLAHFGLRVDETANEATIRGRSGVISQPGQITALVVPTEEELVIARDAHRLAAEAVGGAR